MPEPREILFADLERAARRRDPELATLVIRFLEQGDPPPGQPEDPPEDYRARALPRDAWTLERLRNTVATHNLFGQDPEERRASRNSAWQNLLATPNPPPRLQLGTLLQDLYAAGDEPARSALFEIIRESHRSGIGWGLWQGLKTIYKQAERRHDLAMLGVLIWRFDTMRPVLDSNEISRGTFLYIRRRAWRYLRQLGLAVPELYPAAAAQVLRHYPLRQRFQLCWVANQIWAHADLIGQTDGNAYCPSGPPAELKKRAFDQAWKLDPAPLLRLLEDARNDQVCGFAIRCLEQDFKDTLRHPAPDWLARIGGRRLASLHEFVVKLLTDNPEFHQSKLKGLGLHDMVLGLLYSDSATARRYAVDYARAHAPDMAVATLVELALKGARETKQFAAEKLEKRSPGELGLSVLIRLLAPAETRALAQAKIKQGFQPADLTVELFIALALGNPTQRGFAVSFFQNNKKAVPALYYCQLLDDARCDRQARQKALSALGQLSGGEIGGDWIKQALLKPELSAAVMGWLRKGMFKGEDLDVEWLKGLVMRPALRPLALEVLADRELVTPERIGLSWLLALARQADENLHRFAHLYLLDAFTPADFGPDLDSGVARLWQLASGADEPEPVRAFAQSYLKAHHPVLGPTLAENRALGITPKLAREVYSQTRLEPLCQDRRADVRRLAVTLAREELLRWNDSGLLYRLADSAYREPRTLAAELFLAIDEQTADRQHTPPLDWLTSDVFQLTESPYKTTREVALTLIRRHYERIGGAARLVWLMESPDREVRLFAVRLLWDRHRPAPTPPGWRPAKGAWQAPQERFDSTTALRQFLRAALYGLPPGRMERRELSGDDALPDRPLPASRSKQRLIEVVRDLALDDAAFAELAAPVLEEFRHSRAKGEWQHCVAALAQIRRRYPELQITLPGGSIAAGQAKRPKALR